MKTILQILQRIAEIEVLYGTDGDEGVQSEYQTLCWVLDEDTDQFETYLEEQRKRIAEENSLDWPP